MSIHVSRRAIVVSAAAILLHATANPTPAQTPCELAELLASDGAPESFFGYSVAVSGDTGVIGAWQASGSGAAYVFSFDGLDWVELDVLLPSDGTSGDEFGRAVSVCDDVIAIGAPEYYGSGAAYVFRFDGASWHEETRLMAGDSSPGDMFGAAVSIDNGTVAIGAPGDNDSGSDSGSAYIFRHNGLDWDQEQKLLPADGEELDGFGEAVAVSGDAVVIGAHLDDDKGINSGSAYVFYYDGAGWIEQAKLLAADGAASDEFGDSVAIEGAVALVGATYNDDSGSASGSAYVFRLDGSSWPQEAKLLPSVGAEFAHFGNSVSVFGDNIVIGAETDSENGNMAGAAYWFRFDGSSWTEQAKLLASDGAGSDSFGCSVAVSDDSILSGAPYTDDLGNRSGSAYAFNFADCNGNGVCDVLDITGGSPDCNANGTPDECDVLDGFSEDCNGNEIPDECDVHYSFESSPPLGPIGAGVPQSYTVVSPPVAGSEVQLTFAAVGDLGAISEWVNVAINGEPVGQVFVSGAHDCPPQPDQDTLLVPAGTFNAIVSGGDATVNMTASFAVDPNWCTDSRILVTIEYFAISPGDCNGNGVPDVCDVLAGTSRDVNGNWIPDECEWLVIPPGPRQPVGPLRSRGVSPAPGPNP